MADIPPIPRQSSSAMLLMQETPLGYASGMSCLVSGRLTLAGDSLNDPCLSPSSMMSSTRAQPPYLENFPPSLPPSLPLSLSIYIYIRNYICLIVEPSCDVSVERAPRGQHMYAFSFNSRFINLGDLNIMIEPLNHKTLFIICRTPSRGLKQSVLFLPQKSMNIGIPPQLYSYFIHSLAALSKQSNRPKNET